MKKLISAIFAVCLVFLLGGCSPNNNETRDLSNVIYPISFEMTLSDLKSKLGDPDEISDLSGKSVCHFENQSFQGYAGEYIFRFDEEGYLEFVKFSFSEESDYNEYFNTLYSKLGTPDKVKKDSNGQHQWFGNVHGEKACFYAQQNPFLNYIIEVDKID